MYQKSKDLIRQLLVDRMTSTYNVSREAVVAVRDYDKRREQEDDKGSKFEAS